MYITGFIYFNSIKNSIKYFSGYLSILDLSINLFVVAISLIIIYRNRTNKSKFQIALSNLNKREVIFWGPATFIVLGIICILIIFTTFLVPFGYVQNNGKTLFDLMKIHFSIFPILIFISIPITFYSIYKKSYLKSYASAILLAISLVITIDTYQKVVGKPYLSAVNFFAFAFICLVLIFIVGLFVVLGVLMNKDYFKLSKY